MSIKGLRKPLHPRELSTVSHHSSSTPASELGWKGERWECGGRWQGESQCCSP